MTILAVGRMKPGPEADLTRDRLARFDATGRAHGLGPARVVEVEDKRRRGPEEEARLLLAAAPDGPLIALDERGAALDSDAFARRLTRYAEDGARDLAFAIGGADGHGPALRDRADALLSFGAMTWPHMLVRALLAEQLFRAASIVAGTPYHRGG